MAFRIAILITMGILHAGAAQSPARDSSKLTSSERGRKIFVARCAKCHDGDMRKPLPDGSTLYARLTASKDPRSRLGTRLKDPLERDAVTNYFLALPRASSGK